MVISDLVTHNYEWVREVMADLWLGFAEEQIRDWLTKAGLADITYSSAAVPAPLEDDEASRLNAFVATATKPSETVAEPTPDGTGTGSQAEGGDLG